MDLMTNFLYYILVMLSALLVLPSVTRWFEAREARKAQKENKNESFTLDDVRRLIAEEFDARFSAKTQAS